MSRVPPGLLYLTIYNPTLHPDAIVSPDDEDAEEQAHILFYTARERAVSRDKILRQVGLAKALVNFSDMFNNGEECDNVHSQSRRMVMVSPEPDFWIHACVEVAKTPRPTTPAKTKAKSKGTLIRTEITYDYHDGSIYDIALRTHIMRGYEQFKLIHGSFSSVLNTLGQQALELQLERFFTVWAWRWDIEDDINFGDHLVQIGSPLHPSHYSLTLLLDEFAQQHLPPDAVVFALIPPRSVPSTKLLLTNYSDVLIRYTLSKIPPYPIQHAEVSGDPTAPEVAMPESAPLTTAVIDGTSTQLHKTSANPFHNVDMRNLKWMWTGLTFSKPSSAKSTAPPTPAPMSVTAEDGDTAKTEDTGTPEIKVDDLGHPKDSSNVSVEIDAESLRDAITSENVHSPASRSSVSLPPSSPLSASLQVRDNIATGELDTKPGIEVNQAGPDTADQGIGTALHDESSSATDNISPPMEDQPAPEAQVIRPDPPTFISTPIHLADNETPTRTIRKKVLHATSGPLTLAFVADENHGLDLTQLSEYAVDLFLDMRRCIEEDEAKRDSDKLLPTVTKILEAQDKYIISTGAFTSSSVPPFESKSEHLFRGQELIQSDLDISEVFSRGQNPQHWHVSRRGLGTSSSGEQTKGEVYMEVARKESTLTDVDNELAGVVRRFGEGAANQPS